MFENKILTCNKYGRKERLMHENVLYDQTNKLWFILYIINFLYISSVASPCMMACGAKIEVIFARFTVD